MYNAVAVETNNKVAVDADDYVALQMANEELKNILEIIFSDATLATYDDKLFLKSEIDLMNYLRIVEKRLYNGTVDRLKGENANKEVASSNVNV